MKKLLSALLFLMLPLSALAGGPGAVRKTVEASMLVTGVITIVPNGEVGDYVLDQPDKLPEGIRQFVANNIGAWKFEPMTSDGQPVQVRNKMSLRLIANRLESGDYQIRLSGVNFAPLREVAETGATPKSRLTPPAYPKEAARAGVGGTVYLVLKYGADGHVQDLVAEQVNLRVVASDNQMDTLRKMLANAALRAGRQWEFTPPAIGEKADAPFWTVRVPVDFRLEQDGSSYGKWETYVPGPRVPVPWRRDLRDLPGFSPDTQIAGSVQLVDGEGGLKLLTPLGG